MQWLKVRKGRIVGLSRHEKNQQGITCSGDNGSEM